ncbi:ABC transporter ATP-binding protein [Nocardia wallacei]|uniref:ABC transporter ATP-binding protein n=1 Tax=Nocardia wallacei TaxID=480035 RepID=UPI00245668C4|nr:ABC transporter ATP-binding protein [Nocardia wallacei]
MTVDAVEQLEPDRVALKQQQRAAAAARKRILAPVNGSLTLASLVIAVAAVCAVVPFILIVELCRELLSGSADSDRVWQLLIAAVVVLVVRGVLQAGALAYSHQVDAKFQLSLRELLAAKLTRVPLGWFTDRTSGEVKKFLQDDVDKLHYMVAHARLDFVDAVTVQLVALVYLFIVDWRLALVLLIPLALYARLLGVMMAPAHVERLAAFERSQRTIEDATIEFVDGIQVVRTFGQARKAHNVFQRAVDRTADLLLAWKLPITRLQSASEVLLTPLFLTLVVLVAGIGFVQLDWMAAADVLPFLLVGVGLGGALLGIGYGGQAMRQAAAAAQRLTDLQDTAELAVTAAAGSEPAADATVRFEGVSFGYRRNRNVLHDIDIELRPGTITALVGPSGSGKSTLARLLPRFYDVTDGRITIGGKDVREFSTEELYRTVGFVLQDVRMIRGSIRDNIRLARPDADDATVERAARAAQIHERIATLPRGYDSEIGVDAVLSGGEAQRLSIARTLLADTPVLVLDEATAFADPESEAAVQDALAVLVADRTVLVIAHRLHTITGVDRILVLDKGRVVESGDHATLSGAGGLYQRLWEINEASLVELTGSPAAAGQKEIR